MAARTFIWVVMISQIPNKQEKKSCIPCPNFGESRFPGSSQIPDPVRIFIVFLIPVLYFGQIPDLMNTLPDPVIYVDSFDVLFSIGKQFGLVDQPFGCHQVEVRVVWHGG